MNHKICFNIFFVVVFFPVFLFYVYIIYFNFNPYTIDLAGHFSSALFFKKGLFHQYNHFNFGGYTQGLFYPPLQDIIINIINLCTSFYTACKIYLVCIFLLFIISIFCFLDIFKGISQKITFIMFILIVLFLDKKNYFIYLQGISLEDTLVIGLSAQLLSFSFFLFYVKNMLNDKLNITSSVLLFLILNSHIVTGLVSILITILYLVFEKNTEKIKYILFPIIISSYFIIPFIYYSNYINSSVVKTGIHPENVLFFIVSVILFFVIRQKNFTSAKLRGEISNLNSFKHKKANVIQSFLVFCIIISFIVFLSELILHFEHVIPIKFHFYRLYFYLFIIFFIMCILISDIIINKKVYFIYLLALITCFYFILFYNKMSIIGYNFVQEYFNNVSIDNVIPDLNQSSEINNFVFTSDLSPINTMFRSFQEILRLNGYTLTSVQGTYWESNFSTNILDSYMDSLFLNIGGVTDHLHMEFNSCNEYLNMLDNFISDYAIKYMVFDKENFYAPNLRVCINYLIKSEETSNFKFLKSNIINFRFSNNNYSKYVYKIIDKNSFITNSNVEYMNSDRVLVNPRDPFWFTAYFKDKVNMNTLGQSYKKNEYVFSEPIENDTKLDKIKFKPTFLTIHSGLYKIASPIAGFIKVKLNYMPGLTLTDEQGNKVQIYRGFNFFYFYGKGNFLVEYKKPFVFYLSYIISIISSLCFILWLCRKKSQMSYKKE